MFELLQSFAIYLVEGIALVGLAGLGFKMAEKIVTWLVKI